MQKYRSRAFGDPEDPLAMHRLIVAAWAADGPAVTFHVGDLHWRLRPQPPRDPSRDIRLWFSDGVELAGFAWFDPPEWGDVQCHPDADRGRLEPELFAWLEDRARFARAERLEVGGFEGDRMRSDILKARGYEREDSCVHHTWRSLDTPIETPKVPAGYALRPTRATDLDQQAITVGLAFDAVPKRVEIYHALRSGPAYRNDLDLIVATPDEQVGAFCIGWLDPDNRVGLLEPVGCHPDHRRRGLARTVVHAALRSLRDAGAESAIVCPNSTNPAACTLYESCGFATAADDYDWVVSLGGTSRS